MFIEGQAAIQELLCPSSFTKVNDTVTRWPSTISSTYGVEGIDVSRFATIRIYIRASTTGTGQYRLATATFDGQPFVFRYGDWINDQVVITLPVYGRMFNLSIVHLPVVGAVNYRVEGIYQALSQRTNYTPYLGQGNQHAGTVFGTPEPLYGVTSVTGVCAGQTDIYMPSSNSSRALLVWKATSNVNNAAFYNELKVFTPDMSFSDDYRLFTNTVEQTVSTPDFYSVGLHHVRLTPWVGTQLSYILQLRGLS